MPSLKRALEATHQYAYQAADEEASLEAEGAAAATLVESENAQIRVGRDEYAEIEAELDPEEVRAALQRAEDATARAGKYLQDVEVGVGHGAYRRATKVEQRLTVEGEALALREQMKQDVALIQRLMKRPSFRRLAYSAATAMALMGGLAVGVPSAIGSLAGGREMRAELARLDSDYSSVDYARGSARADFFNEKDQRFAEQITYALFRSGKLDQLIRANDRDGLKKEVARLFDAKKITEPKLSENVYYFVDRQLAEEARLRSSSKPDEALRLFEMTDQNPLELYDDISVSRRQMLLPQAVHRYLSILGNSEEGWWMFFEKHTERIGWLATVLPGGDLQLIKRELQKMLDNDLFLLREDTSREPLTTGTREMVEARLRKNQAAIVQLQSY